MNERETNGTGAEVDANLRSSYRAAASEAAPADLDRAVLQKARRELAGAVSRQYTWFRPVAFAATVALSLALLLNFTETGMVDSPLTGDEAAGIDRPATNGGRNEPQQDTSSAAEAFGDAAEAAEKNAENPEQAANVRLQPSPSPAIGETRPDGTAALPASTVTANDACNDSQRASPGDWWRCIEALRENGRVDDAAAELEAFRATYPDYMPPE